MGTRTVVSAVRDPSTALYCQVEQEKQPQETFEQSSASGLQGASIS